MHTSGVPLASHLGLFPWNYPRSRSCTIPSPTRLPVIPPSQHPPHPGPREHPPGSRHRRLLLPISELQMGILQHVVISTDFDQHKLSEIYPYCCRDPGFVFFFFFFKLLCFLSLREFTSQSTHLLADTWLVSNLGSAGTAVSVRPWGIQASFLRLEILGHRVTLVHL